MVKIKSPSTVEYLSDAELICTYDEDTDSAGWNMTRPNQRFELNNGTVVTVNNTCFTDRYNSCVAVTINRTTGLWEGKWSSFTIPEVKLKSSLKYPCVCLDCIYMVKVVITKKKNN